MKKALLLLCSILTVHCLSAEEFENKYGNGVVHIEPDSFTTIDFYSGPDSALIYRLHMRFNSWSFSTIVNGAMVVGIELPQWFSTVYFIPYGEYARVDILALDSGNGYYRTLLEDNYGREIWIKKTKEVTFLSWLGFYSTVASIELNEGDLILYDKPDAKSKRVNYTPMMSADDRGYMRALEIKGQWMKVELQIPEHNPLMSWKTYTGWIRWRDDKQPLIKYNLMGC